MGRRLFKFAWLASTGVAVAAWTVGFVGTGWSDEHEEWRIDNEGRGLGTLTIRHSTGWPCQVGNWIDVFSVQTVRHRHAPGGSLTDSRIYCEFNPAVVETPPPAGHNHPRGPATVRRRELRVSQWWALLLVSARPAILAVQRSLSARRLAAGRCLACGYDLRATPDRCPECGAAPTGAA